MLTAEAAFLSLGPQKCCLKCLYVHRQVCVMDCFWVTQQRPDRAGKGPAHILLLSLSLPFFSICPQCVLQCPPSLLSLLTHGKSSLEDNGSTKDRRYVLDSYLSHFLRRVLGNISTHITKNVPYKAITLNDKKKYRYESNKTMKNGNRLCKLTKPSSVYCLSARKRSESHIA